MLVHQAAQGRAVALVIIFLQRAGRHAIKPKEIAEVQRDPLIDLRPEIAIRGRERVVEIEDPSVDAGQGIGGRRGLAGTRALPMGRIVQDGFRVFHREIRVPAP